MSNNNARLRGMVVGFNTGARQSGSLLHKPEPTETKEDYSLIPELTEPVAAVRPSPPRPSAFNRMGRAAEAVSWPEMESPVQRLWRTQPGLRQFAAPVRL